jgi:hypothetical protein
MNSRGGLDWTGWAGLEWTLGYPGLFPRQTARSESSGWMCIVIITGPFSAWHRGRTEARIHLSPCGIIEVRTVCLSVCLPVRTRHWSATAAADIGLLTGASSERDQPTGVLHVSCIGPPALLRHVDECWGL